MSTLATLIIIFALGQGPVFHDRISTDYKAHQQSIVADAKADADAGTVSEQEQEQEQEQALEVPIDLSQVPGNLWVLTNKETPLTRDFKPKDIVLADVAQKYGDTKLPLVVSEALKAMFEGANEAGYTLYLSSGYRDYGFQQTLYQQQVKKNGAAEANRWVAKPGESEHQTGLAVDITAKSVSMKLTTEFEATEEYAWLYKNCAQYGFILRYPKGEEATTGYGYEPWHYRYIGDVGVAQYIMENKLTYEGYLKLRGF